MTHKLKAGTIVKIEGFPARLEQEVEVTCGALDQLGKAKGDVANGRMFDHEDVKRELGIGGHSP